MVRDHGDAARLQRLSDRGFAAGVRLNYHLLRGAATTARITKEAIQLGSRLRGCGNDVGDGKYQRTENDKTTGRPLHASSWLSKPGASTAVLTLSLSNLLFMSCLQTQAGP